MKASAARPPPPPPPRRALAASAPRQTVTLPPRLTRDALSAPPQFGKYLEANQRPQWRPYYIDYKALKDLIKEAAAEASDESALAASPRTTSLSVVRAAGRRDTAEERFFRRLEAEVRKVGQFTQQLVDQLRTRLTRLQQQVAAAAAAEAAEAAAEAAGGAGPSAAPPGGSFRGSFRAGGGGGAPPAPAPAREDLLDEAKSVGDEFLALEKYVNLNYMGFHKILKKHDKQLPHTPCRQFYVSHLHNQPWVQGKHSDLMVILSNCFSQLRGDRLAEAVGGSAQAFNRSTTKYWVATDAVSAVKRTIIENMPVFVFNEENYSGDAQLVNSVYFDNENAELYHGRLDKKPGALAIRVRWYGPADPRLCFVERKTHRESWKGEKSVKERFTLPEDRVVAYIEGEYSAAEFAEGLRAKGKAEDDVRRAAALFEDIQKQIEAKQLRPFVRTQYMRSAFQMGHDRTVSFTLDTNLVMLKENPEGHPTCAISGRWYRDPRLPIHRTEITRFPHAVLEVKLALPEGAAAPEWVQSLQGSGLITEVHKMSKFIHGTAVLFPELVQAVPYWIDDESVRDSIRASAPEAAPVLAT
jgi:SPX domain protein involved in polyphosphate accumulation